MLIAAVQAGILPQLTKRLGDYRTLLLGVICALIAFTAFGLAAAVWAVVIFLPIAALSDMAPPLLTAFAANRVGDDLQGLVQGVIASLSSVAAVIAPLIFTGVFENFVNGTSVYLPGAPFLMSGVLILAILPLIWRLDPKRFG